MSSGCVVGTSSTTICEPASRSKAASLASSAPRWPALRVAVSSITRPLRGGTGSTSCASAPVAHSSAAMTKASARARKFTEALLRRRLVEAHRRRPGDLGFVLHREVGLGLVAEHHRGEIGREAARQYVVLGHRLDVAVARHGDAVLGALELHAQVTEALIRL